MSKSGNEVDAKAHQDYVAWVVSEQVSGVSCLLSAGEFGNLSDSDRREVVKATVRGAQKKVPVLAGVSTQNLSDTIDLAIHAQDEGVDCIMVMPRSYFVLTEDEILRYFESIINSVKVPIGIYNNPVTTGVDISAALYERICQLGDVAVTKEGSGDFLRVPQLAERCPDLTQLTGTENFFLAAMLHGAHGCCNAIASVLPRQIVEIYSSIKSENWDDAVASYNKLVPLYTFIRKHSVVRTMRALAHLLGVDIGPHRLPMQGFAPEKFEQLRRVALESGLSITEGQFQRAVGM